MSRGLYAHYKDFLFSGGNDHPWRWLGTYDVGVSRLSIAGKPGGCTDEFASWNTTSQVCRPDVDSARILVVPELVAVKKRFSNWAGTGKFQKFIQKCMATAKVMVWIVLSNLVDSNDTCPSLPKESFWWRDVAHCLRMEVFSNMVLELLRCLWIFGIPIGNHHFQVPY